MVAADVDSDLFDAGAPDNDDGGAVANLTYRITALYSGRDSDSRPGGTSCPDKLFGAAHAQRTIAAWVDANV